MTAFCQPLTRSIAEQMLQVAARALCDRAGDSPEQRDGRTHQMGSSVLGLAPRDGLELMLATLAFGHFQIILDSMGDVFRGQSDALKARTKTAIVPLGRAMLEMLKELRLAQVRPMLQAAEQTPGAEATEVPPQQDAVPTQDEFEEAAALSEAELATLRDPRLGLSEEVIAWLAETAPAPGSPEPGVAQPAAPSPGDRTAAGRLPFRIVAATGPMAPNADLPGWEDPSKSAEEDIASYHESLAAAYETLAQGRVEIAKAKAASGD